MRLNLFTKKDIINELNKLVETGGQFYDSQECPLVLVKAYNDNHSDTLHFDGLHFCKSRAELYKRNE